MSQAKPFASLRSYQLAGLLLTLLLFAGFGGWAAFASISGAVIGEARVVVETKPKKLQHPDGGIVAEILVTDGERVEAGQLLVRLDDAELRGNLAIVNTRLNELITRRARLEAERDRGNEIIFPAEVTDHFDDSNVKTAYVGQKNIFEARRKEKQGTQEQLRSKIEQLSQEIAGTEAQQNARERQLALIEQELTDLQFLRDKGLVKESRFLALQRELARLQGERGSLIAEIARKRGEISETHLRIIQIDQNFTSEIVKELQETQTNIAELVERRLGLQIRLQRTEIRSPRSGIVHQLNVHTIGGVVTAGEPILLIVPEQDKLIFEARIRPLDIDQIRLGQKTTIRLHAFDPGLRAELAGEVTVVSPDSIVETQTNTQYYIVRIEIANEELTKLGKHFLVPGMIAEAFIETDSRTVLRYLSKPFFDRIPHVFRER